MALGIQLCLLQKLIDREPPKAKDLAARLQADGTEALDNLRDLARASVRRCWPTSGLIAALVARARKSATRVGRYAQEIEATFYFCILEARQKIAKCCGVNIFDRAGDQRHCRGGE